MARPSSSSEAGSPRLRVDLDLPVIRDYGALLRSGRPLIDTRAPVEFAQGSFPGAVNLPLLDDEQRKRIGTCYKQQGHEAAVRLGARLVSGEVRRARIAAWADFLHAHPDAALFCFRGGMRSRVTQQWLFEEAGLRCPRIAGGYKALRRFLIETIDDEAVHGDPLVLGGRTGSGKTRLLRRLANAIDLEGLANHRGSAFGPTATPQPTPIAFENRLGVALLRAGAAGHQVKVYEDEGPNIGLVRTPAALYRRLQQAPLVVMRVSDAEREENSLREYIDDTLADHIAAFGETLGYERFADYLVTSLDKIRKRLGGERHARLRREMIQAIARHRVSGDRECFRPIIRALLFDYYDPMYDYQIEKKRHRILFEGGADAVLAFLDERGTVL